MSEPVTKALLDVFEARRGRLLELRRERDRRTPKLPELDDDRPPICPACGVTMVPAELSANAAEGDWVCVECEELSASA